MVLGGFLKYEKPVMNQIRRIIFMENRMFKTSALALVLLFMGQFASAMQVNPTPVNEEKTIDGSDITVKGVNEKTETTEKKNEKTEVKEDEKTDIEVKELDAKPGFFSKVMTGTAVPFVWTWGKACALFSTGYNAFSQPLVTLGAAKDSVTTSAKKASKYLYNTKNVVAAQDALCLAKNSLGELLAKNAKLAFDLIDASDAVWTPRLVNANTACAEAGVKLLDKKDELINKLTNAKTTLEKADKLAKVTAQLVVNKAALNVIEAAAKVKADDDLNNGKDVEKFQNGKDVEKFQNLLQDRNNVLFECADSVKEIKHKDKVDNNPEVVGNEKELKAYHDAFGTEEYKKAYNAKIDADSKLFAARHWMYVGTKTGVKNAALATVKFPVNHYWWTAGVAGVAAFGVTYALLTGRSVPGFNFVSSKLGSLFKTSPKVQEILQKQLSAKLA